MDTIKISILTSVITILFTTPVVHWIKQVMDNKNSSQRKRKSVIASLLTEVECLHNIILDRLKSVDQLKNNPSRAYVTMCVGNDYFRIFDSLAADLSSLQSTELSSKIIKTYFETKGLFDDVTHLSSNALELKRAVFLSQVIPSKFLDPLICSQIEFFDMIAYKRAPEVCSSLKELINDLKGAK